MDKRPWYKKLFAPPKAAASPRKPKDDGPSIAQRINWPGAGGSDKKKPKSGWQKPKK